MIIAMILWSIYIKKKPKIFKANSYLFAFKSVIFVRSTTGTSFGVEVTCDACDSCNVFGVEQSSKRLLTLIFPLTEDSDFDSSLRFTDSGALVLEFLEEDCE